MEKPCCVDAPGFRMLMATNKLADEKGLEGGRGLAAPPPGRLSRRRQGNPRRQAGRRGLHAGLLGRQPRLVPRREPGESEMHYQVRNWYHFVWLSGDNICEQHVHNLDVGNWIKGDHPVEANGMGYCVQRYLGRDPKKGMGQIFDYHFVEFTYKDGAKMFSQCRQIAQHLHQRVGGGPRHQGRTAARAAAAAPQLKYRDPYEQEHYDLLAAIRNNEKYNEGWYGATSSFTAVLGRMATYSGKGEVGRGRCPRSQRISRNSGMGRAPRALPDARGTIQIPLPGTYKPY